MKIAIAILTICLVGCCNFRWPNIVAKIQVDAHFEMHPQQRVTETDKKITTDE